MTQPDGPCMVSKTGVHVQHFDDGSLGVAVTTNGKSALHLNPGQAAAFMDFVRMVDQRKAPVTVLTEAAQIIHSDREQTHGEPAKNLGAIASMWGPIFGTTVTPQQVCLAMIALKVARAERERFEKWARARSPGTQIGLALHDDGPQRGEYVDDDYEWAWIAWQARAALDVPELTFTAPEAVALLECFGGECGEWTVRKLPEGVIAGDDYPVSPAGLWAHMTDYPEEGAIWLGEADSEAKTARRLHRRTR